MYCLYEKGKNVKQMDRIITRNQLTVRIKKSEMIFFQTHNIFVKETVRQEKFSAGETFLNILNFILIMKLLQPMVWSGWKMV